MKTFLFPPILFIGNKITFGPGGDRKFKGQCSFLYARISQENDINNGFAVSLELKVAVPDQLAVK